jgi:MFS family permease
MFIPLIWVFTGVRVFWIVPFAEGVSGGIWQALELSAQNMYLARSPEEGRSMYIAVYTMLIQVIGNALAYMTGGWLVENALGWVQGLHVLGFEFSRYTGIFVISCILRVIVYFTCRPLIRDPEDSMSAKRMIGEWVAEGKLAMRRLAARAR